MKLYTKGDGEGVYPLSYFKKLAKSEDQEIIIYECERSKATYFMLCNWAWELVKKGDCGKFCNGYSPRNGKSGNCKHNGLVYDAIGDAILIKP